MTKSLLLAFGNASQYSLDKFFFEYIYISPISNYDLYHKVSNHRKRSLQIHLTKSDTFDANIDDIQTGENHVLIREQSEIAAIGYGDCGQLGMSSLTKRHGISNLRNVSRIWCGMNCSFAETLDKRLYGCGWNAQCQISPHIIEKEVQMWRELPKSLLFPDITEDLVDIISASLHTFFVFEDPESNFGVNIYITGSNQSAACAVPDHSQGKISKVNTSVLESYRYKLLRTCDTHTYFLMECGTCFANGHEFTRSSGHDTKFVPNDQYYMNKVLLPNNEKILDVATNSKESFFLTKSGYLYSTTTDNRIVKVILPTTKPISHLVAGYAGYVFVDKDLTLFIHRNSNLRCGNQCHDRTFKCLHLRDYLPKGKQIGSWEVKQVKMTRSYLLCQVKENENIKLKKQMLKLQSKRIFVEVVVNTQN